jgi:hypothetical protein
VSLRGGFSDRNNIKPENTTIQTDSLDRRTRVALCNATNIIVYHGALYSDVFHEYRAQEFVKHVYADIYGQRVDWNKTYDRNTVLAILLDTIENDDYDAVLTVIEYVAREVHRLCPMGVNYRGKLYTVSKIYNRIFEQEYVGYRFVGCKLTPITDPVEIASIEDAVSAEHDAVREHIEKALHLLSDRESPDYENSIKESISSVERLCSVIVGKSTTLGDALSKLQSKGMTINPQMKAAFDKLYAYTNGASGIRHAGQIDGPDATFAEAKFMLVSCCAFVNYLMALMAD